MNRLLFQQRIDGWDSWGRVFQSTEAFAPLVRAVLRREDLPADDPVQALTPGTNAVFLAGETVVKLYAPEESGVHDLDAAALEDVALRRAAACGLRVPRPLAVGIFDDRYRFPYLLTERLKGREAGPALRETPAGERAAFARMVRQNLDKLNVPYTGHRAAEFTGRAVQNASAGQPRWKRCSARFLALRDGWLREAEPPGETPVFLHGDVTGDNTWISPDGFPAFLDFGDASMAPRPVEYAAVVADLFDWDPAMTAAFCGDQPADTFARELLRGMLLHDFGEEFLRLAGRRLLGDDAAPFERFEPLLAALTVLAQGISRPR